MVRGGHIEETLRELLHQCDIVVFLSDDDGGGGGGGGGALAERSNFRPKTLDRRRL